MIDQKHLQQCLAHHRQKALLLETSYMKKMWTLRVCSCGSEKGLRNKAVRRCLEDTGWGSRLVLNCWLSTVSLQGLCRSQRTRVTCFSFLCPYCDKSNLREKGLTLTHNLRVWSVKPRWRSSKSISSWLDLLAVRTLREEFEHSACFLLFIQSMTLAPRVVPPKSYLN